MHSWQVQCIESVEDPEFNDCRSIETLGFLVAASVNKIPVETAAAQIQQGHRQFHVVQDSERLEVKPVMNGSDTYVRTLERDAPNDPLLELPSLPEYKRKREWEQRGF